MGGKNTNNATRRAILRERREKRQKRQKQAAKKAQKAQQGVDGKTDMTEDGTAIAPPPPPSSPAAATITGTSATAPVAAKGSKAVRRYRHRIREINSSMKAWKDDLRDYKKAKFRAAELEQQLQEVKKQVSDLNAAVNFLLQQAPNNGHFFHEHWGMWDQWTRKS